MEKRAVLVVSFGTSYEDTRKKTIDVIREEIGSHFPGSALYEAWTSGMIIRKVKERDGYAVDTVKEAAKKMVQDGITHLIVQPTHVINGIENDKMKAEILAYRNQFETIAFGEPLLSGEYDSFEVIRAIMGEVGAVEAGTALVLMGHGTSHYVNATYAALDYQFKEQGYDNVFVGTVEAYPGLETVKKIIRKEPYKKVILMPFMIVAGDHAQNDMAGEEEDSWRSQLEGEGYQVSCILKGLGEYQEIRSLLVKHALEAK